MVTRDGVPVADLLPHQPLQRPPRFPPTAALGEFLAPSPLNGEAWLAAIKAGDDVLDDDPADEAWSR